MMAHENHPHLFDCVSFNVSLRDRLTFPFEVKSRAERSFDDSLLSDNSKMEFKSEDFTRRVRRVDDDLLFRLSVVSNSAVAATAAKRFDGARLAFDGDRGVFAFLVLG